MNYKNKIRLFGIDFHNEPSQFIIRIFLLNYPHCLLFCSYFALSTISISVIESNIYPSIKNLTHKQENTHQMINSFTGLDSLRTNITIISCCVKTGDQLCSNSSPYEVSKGVFSAKTIRQIFVVLRRLA